MKSKWKQPLYKWDKEDLNFLYSLCQKGIPPGHMAPHLGMCREHLRGFFRRQGVSPGTKVTRGNSSIPNPAEVLRLSEIGGKYLREVVEGRTSPKTYKASNGVSLPWVQGLHEIIH